MLVIHNTYPKLLETLTSCYQVSLYNVLLFKFPPVITWEQSHLQEWKYLILTHRSPSILIAQEVYHKVMSSPFIHLLKVRWNYSESFTVQKEGHFVNPLWSHSGVPLESFPCLGFHNLCLLLLLRLCLIQRFLSFITQQLVRGKPSIRCFVPFSLFC